MFGLAGCIPMIVHYLFANKDSVSHFFLEFHFSTAAGLDSKEPKYIL